MSCSNIFNKDNNEICIRIEMVENIGLGINAALVGLLIP